MLLGRFLGVWNRTFNKQQALDDLSRAIAIETYASNEFPNQYDNPRFIKFGEFVEKLANRFGLAYRNVAGRIFEVTLDGKTDEAFGILTHADVVPVNKNNWVLDDGTKLEPFDMTVIGNKIYGRGTIDDKSFIISALYAMNAIKESGIPLQRDIRLMIETTEETSGAGMQYYLEHNDIPKYNIVLDSDYPAVIAEKGYGTINVYFPVVKNDGDVVIEDISAGTATNQIPGTASATLKTTDSAALKSRITAMVGDYTDGPNGTFDIDVEAADGSVTLTVKGTSAHASEPESGNNPLPRLMKMLVESDLSPADNHWLAASKYINELYGEDYTGKKMGVAYADDFMGPLTLAPTFTEIDAEKGARIAVNVRAPRGMSKEELKSALEEKLNAWKSSAAAQASFDVETTDWMYRDPDGRWLTTLLDIYGDTTGELAEPISSAGSTTAKLLPNAINFGPNFPGDKYMGHNANEFKRLDVFNYDLQMFTEMMVRISNLDKFE